MPLLSGSCASCWCGDALVWAAEIVEFAPATLAYSKRALELLHEPRPWDPVLDEDFAACWRDRQRGR